MKIHIKADAVSGRIHIPRGEYMATAVPERSAIQLSGRGIDLLIPAVKRPVKANVKGLKVQFYSLGGANWTIAIAIPKRGEWISFIQMTGGGGGGSGGGDQETYVIPSDKG